MLQMFCCVFADSLINSIGQKIKRNETKILFTLRKCFHLNSLNPLQNKIFFWLLKFHCSKQALLMIKTKTQKPTIKQYSILVT